MCFELDSSPPIPEIAGAAVSHDDLVLTSADGTRFAAFSALPDAPTSIGIVVLPDVRGLYRFYEELALRLAERGYAAIAFDYFGRTAGVGKRDDDFPYMEHVAQTDPASIQADLGAAAAWLRSPEGGARERIFTRRLLLRRAQLLARRGRRPRARRRRRLLRQHRGARRPSRPDPARRADDGARARAAGRRRRQHHRGGQRRLRRCADRGRASHTRSSPTTARRTASSTAGRRSTRQPRMTRGIASSRFIETHT